MMFKAIINDRSYCDTAIKDITTDRPTEEIKIKMRENKLFNFDLFTVNPFIIKHSYIRFSKLPAILILDKTYGRKNNKLLYKCIPDDRRIPIFLVPYNLKLKFNKNNVNKFVVMKFIDWDQEHPTGQVEQVLGDVDSLEAFYEYQLYSNSLFASIQKLNRETMAKIKKKAHRQHIIDIKQQYKMEDRTDHNVITIDPIGSKDFDDGVSIRVTGNETIISIYIANVAVWLDYLKLWKSFSDRVATIYFPNRKKPMLPLILSDMLCSLQEGVERFAVVCDLHIDGEFNIVKTKYSNVFVNVNKNYTYESDELKRSETYQLLLTSIKKLNSKKKYIASIKDSHDAVAYLMIVMNYYVAQSFKNKKVGIFRGVNIVDTKERDKIDDEQLKKFITFWNSTGGKYVRYESITSHDFLELDAYVHVTSPIRRLVDLLNQITVTTLENNTYYSKDAIEFYNTWITKEKIDYINICMKAIRKVQNNCQIITKLVTNPELLDKTYDGLLFDKIERREKFYQYMVYFPEIKMVSKFMSENNIDNYSIRKFKCFLFNEEHTLKKKIKITFAF